MSSSFGLVGAADGREARHGRRRRARRPCSTCCARRRCRPPRAGGATTTMAYFALPPDSGTAGGTTRRRIHSEGSLALGIPARSGEYSGFVEGEGRVAVAPAFGRRAGRRPRGDRSREACSRTTQRVVRTDAGARERGERRDGLARVDQGPWGIGQDEVERPVPCRRRPASRGPTSAATTCARPWSPGRRCSPGARRAPRGDDSTNVACAAPRDRASRARAPVPA